MLVVAMGRSRLNGLTDEWDDLHWYNSFRQCVSYRPVF